MSATAALALDTGSEPIYQILPEIPIAGAAIPMEAPGFAVVDRSADSEIVRRGRLFRVAGDPRIYGRMGSSAVSVPLNDDTHIAYARSPADQFLAQVVTRTERGGDMVRVMALTNDAEPMTMDATMAATLLTPAACGAQAAGSPGKDALPPRLVAAAWQDEADIRMVWQFDQDTKSPAQTVDTVVQMAGVAKPELVRCTVAAAGSATDAAPAAPYRRDMIGRLRVLTFYRLAVMREATDGRRPLALNTQPGPVFSSLSTGDPVVQQALTAMQPVIQVASPVPAEPVLRRDRPRATGFVRPVENGLPRPNFTRAGFGLIPGEGSRRFLNQGAEGGLRGLGNLDD